MSCPANLIHFPAAANNHAFLKKMYQRYPGQLRLSGNGAHLMNEQTDKIVVYYDGSCPKCVRDRRLYEKLSGKADDEVCWFDITGREHQLKTLGIDPKKALSELHVKDTTGRIMSEMDAYILLMNKVLLLKPLAWLISLPGIRPFLTRWYHRQVNRRLKRRGLIE
jgi:predicted DCC family thiol-disulfide oxidoreductase YuxK